MFLLIVYQKKAVFKYQGSLHLLLKFMHKLTYNYSDAVDSYIIDGVELVYFKVAFNDINVEYLLFGVQLLVYHKFQFIIVLDTYFT